jgi:hypothetical protein
LLIAFQVVQLKAAHLLIEKFPTAFPEPNQNLQDRRPVNPGHAADRPQRDAFNEVMDDADLIVDAEYICHNSLSLCGGESFRIVLVRDAIRRFAGLCSRPGWPPSLPGFSLALALLYSHKSGLQVRNLTNRKIVSTFLAWMKKDHAADRQKAMGHKPTESISGLSRRKRPGLRQPRARRI